MDPRRDLPSALRALDGFMWPFVIGVAHIVQDADGRIDVESTDDLLFVSERAPGTNDRTREIVTSDRYRSSLTTGSGALFENTSTVQVNARTLVNSAHTNVGA